jgi:phosphotriesterase-related protein
VQDSWPWELVTTLGPKGRGELGVILPHEHVFLDLRTWESPGHGVAETEEVIRRVSPEISRVRKAGVTVIVEPTTLGVGRRADVLAAVSEATGMPLVVPTGVYREPWIPPWVHDAEPEELREWMIGELRGEIEGTGVRAGWIKVSAGDDGLTMTETKILRAAAEAAVATGVLIGSHTVRGRVALEQLDVLEATGLSPERFVWIHAQREPDFSLHLEAARRGAWLEYDGIGRKRMPQGTDGAFVELVLRALHNGLAERLLLSGDMLGYDASLPNGGEVEPYAYLCETFLPKLVAAGVDDATLHQLTQDNPFDAFARQGRKAARASTSP